MPCEDVQWIAIAVDPECGGRVVQLAVDYHVWACESVANVDAVEEVWAASVETDRGSATHFKWSARDTPEDALIDVLPMVDLHHGGWSRLRVIGARASDVVRSELARFAAVVATEQDDGFSARRSPTVPPSAS